MWSVSYNLSSLQAHPISQTEVLSSTLQSIHISADSVGDNSNISTLSKMTEEGKQVLLFHFGHVNIKDSQGNFSKACL